MIKLFNREEEYLHDLKPLSAINKEVLNGEDFLNMLLDNDVEIQKKNRALIYIDKYNTWKEFIVEEVTENRTEGTIDTYAENSLYELIGDFIEDRRAYDTTANIALGRVLENTRWEVGRVDDLGIASASFYRINAKEALDKVVKAWNAELQVRIEISGNKIVHRYVDLLSQRGDYLGERFVTGENIDSITRTVEDDYIATALYGFGKGEELTDEEGESSGSHGRRIDFSSINNGKMYVEDNDARLKWGRLNSDGTKSHIFAKVEFDDEEDIHELKRLTEERLEILKDPKVKYEGKIIDSVARLGDTVLLIDEENKPNLRLTARVFEIENDLLQEENSSPVLGNYIEDITDELNRQNEFIDNFRGKQGIWDRADRFDKDGNLNSRYLDGVIDVLKNQLLSTNSNWYTDDRGNLVFDAEDGSSSMMLSGGGFMIANMKDAAGNWLYRTFGTGNGFVADEIITGILKGGKVKFDLTNGTLLIGNSENDYKLLFDGENLNIRLGSGKTIEKEISDIESKMANGELYLKGTGYNRNFPRVMKLNKETIYESGGRGLRLTVIRRHNLTIAHDQTYDIYSIESEQNALADKLNSLDSSVIVTLTSNDAFTFNSKLITAMEICGTSGLEPSRRSPYAFVGIPGIGRGAGVEVITEPTTTAPFAEISTKIVDGVPQGINSNLKALQQDMDKYNDGQLKGTKYTFDGDSFKIGNWAGDGVEHGPTASAYRHSDGSYTRISSNGLERRVGSTGKPYHYLIDIQTFIFGTASSTHTLTLPADFRGKDFNVYLAIADTMQAPKGASYEWHHALHKAVATFDVGGVDKATGTVKVRAYTSYIDVRSSGPAPKQENIQGMMIAIY